MSKGKWNTEDGSRPVGLAYVECLACSHDVATLVVWQWTGSVMSASSAFAGHMKKHLSREES